MQLVREFPSAFEATTSPNLIGELPDLHRAHGERALMAAGDQRTADDDA